MQIVFDNLPKVICTLTEQPPPDLTLVYGSYLQSYARKDSDLDFVSVWDSRKPLHLEIHGFVDEALPMLEGRLYSMTSLESALLNGDVLKAFQIAHSTRVAGSEELEMRLKSTALSKINIERNKKSSELLENCDLATKASLLLMSIQELESSVLSSAELDLFQLARSMELVRFTLQHFLEVEFNKQESNLDILDAIILLDRQDSSKVLSEDRFPLGDGFKSLKDKLAQALLKFDSSENRSAFFKTLREVAETQDSQKGLLIDFSPSESL